MTFTSLTFSTILFNNKELDGATGPCHKPSKIMLLICSRNGGGISTKNAMTYKIQNIFNTIRKH